MEIKTRLRNAKKGNYPSPTDIPFEFIKMHQT